MAKQKKTSITTKTLSDAQDAARRIFQEAANAWPAVRRFYASKSKHFSVIQDVDPTCFADLAAWLYLLDNKDCPDRFLSFGPNASDQLELYCYQRLSECNDEALARLMDALRTRRFRLNSSAERIAILQSLVKRKKTKPLSDTLWADVDLLFEPESPLVIYSRVARIREQETRSQRKLMSLYRELSKAVGGSNSPRKRSSPNLRSK